MCSLRPPPRSRQLPVRNAPFFLRSLAFSGYSKDNICKFYTSASGGKHSCIEIFKVFCSKVKICVCVFINISLVHSLNFYNLTYPFNG